MGASFPPSGRASGAAIVPSILHPREQRTVLANIWIMITTVQVRKPTFRIYDVFDIRFSAYEDMCAVELNVKQFN